MSELLQMIHLIFSYLVLMSQYTQSSLSCFKVLWDVICHNHFYLVSRYIEFFPKPVNTANEFLFEKSATYFDSPQVPMRVHALLPHAKIICILISPAKRAYSWYQVSWNVRVLMQKKSLWVRERGERSTCLWQVDVDFQTTGSWFLLELYCF